MRQALIVAAGVFAFACTDRPLTDPGVTTVNRSAAASSGGFDQFGYNKGAGMFNGAADGVDRVLDGKLWGSPSPYASDHLVMKWNAEWDRGNREAWSKPPYGAWMNNQWTGMSAGSSGSVWHYKFKWIGSCGADYTFLPDGGYCIWGQFEVIQDHGLDPSWDEGHIWFAKAIPGGYGR